MVNNIKRKKFYYDKDMKRDEILSEVVTLFSIIIGVIAFINTFLNTAATLLVSAIVLILVLPYIGCKYDEIRGYD